MINGQLLRDKSVAKKITDIRSEKEHTTSSCNTTSTLLLARKKDKQGKTEQNNDDIGALHLFFLTKIKRFVGRAWSPRASV